MSSIEEKFERFIEFSFDGKLERLLRKASDEELMDLYSIYAPMYWNDHSNMRYKAMGSMAIYAIGTEFKHRYPGNSRLQDWDYGLHSSQVNLSDLVVGGRW